MARCCRSGRRTAAASDSGRTASSRPCRSPAAAPSCCATPPTSGAVPGAPRGSSFSRGASADRCSRFRPNGSEPVQVTTLDPSRRESLETAPVYAEPGWLVFGRHGTLAAQRFDARARYQAASWTCQRRVVAKVEWHKGELFPRVGFVVTNLHRSRGAEARRKVGSAAGDDPLIALARDAAGPDAEGGSDDPPKGSSMAPDLVGPSMRGGGAKCKGEMLAYSVRTLEEVTFAA